MVSWNNAKKSFSFQLIKNTKTIVLKRLYLWNLKASNVYLYYSHMQKLKGTHESILDANHNSNDLKTQET
jgi:hypothetical protein